MRCGKIKPQDNVRKRTTDTAVRHVVRQGPPQNTSSRRFKERIKMHRIGRWPVLRRSSAQRLGTTTSNSEGPGRCALRCARPWAMPPTPSSPCGGSAAAGHRTSSTWTSRVKGRPGPGTGPRGGSPRARSSGGSSSTNSGTARCPWPA